MIAQALQARSEFGMRFDGSDIHHAECTLDTYAARCMVGVPPTQLVEKRIVAVDEAKAAMKRLGFTLPPRTIGSATASTRVSNAQNAHIETEAEIQRQRHGWTRQVAGRLAQ
jgi:hypothetical protein